MWRPAKSLNWQLNAECAKPENSHYIDLFFSKNPKERNTAKNLCFSCPVRDSCLQWALEHKQIWGVWGGRDELELRRALSVSHVGEEVRRKRPPHCPYCSGWPRSLSVSIENLPGGGRWTTAKVVTCSECGFAWKSRTSANAVDAYKSSKKDKKTKDSPKEVREQ